jgi:hypothetical protein
MNIWSLIAGILAAACFALDFFRPGVTTSGERPWRFGSLVSLGLFFFVLSWMLQLLVTTTNPITT